MKKGFTLAETIVTVGIIGVIAAVCVPAIITANQQTTYRTKYIQAISDINAAISRNIANGKKSAYYTTEDEPLFNYLQTSMPKVIGAIEESDRDSNNSEFSTTGGMRYEFPGGDSGSDEFDNISFSYTNSSGTTKTSWDVKNYGCGTKGLGIGGSAKAQSATPCMVLVDVNGDSNPNTLTADNASTLSDMFLIIVTDSAAYPYGNAAQTAYYLNE